MRPDQVPAVLTQPYVGMLARDFPHTAHFEEARP